MNETNHTLLRNISADLFYSNQLEVDLNPQQTADLTQSRDSIYSEWSAHLDWWFNLCACLLSEGCPNLAFGLSNDLCVCLAHGLAGQAEVTQGAQRIYGRWLKACPGSPDGSMVTRGDTPLARNRREVLMQEIIWLYNPELAVKLQLQRRRFILD